MLSAAPASASRQRTALAAISYANLAFLAVWGEALDPQNYYFLAELPNATFFLAIPFTVALYAVPIFFVLRFCASLPAGLWRRLMDSLLLALLIVPLNSARLVTNSLVSETHEPLTVLIMAAALLSLLIAGILKRKKTLGVVTAVLMILSPLFLINSATAAKRAYDTSKDPILAGEPSRSSPTRAPSTRRLVIVLFDELDYELLTDFRPKALQLVTFDELLAQSVVFANAASPANATLLAVPSLLTGRTVAKATPRSPGSLAVEFRDGSSGRLESTDTFFDDAHRLESRTGVVGVYHPYCRLFADRLDRCEFYGVRPRYSMSGAVARHAALQLHSVPFAYRLSLAPPVTWWRDPSHEPIEDTLRSLHESAREMVSDPALDLVYLHYPVPHSPYIREGKTGQYAEQQSDYFDNLALVDQFLGDLISGLDHAKLREKTTVMVVSDHGLKDDPTQALARLHPAQRTAYADIPRKRVPLVINGAGSAARIAEPICTQVLRSFVVSHLRAEPVGDAITAAVAGADC